MSEHGSEDEDKELQVSPTQVVIDAKEIFPSSSQSLSTENLSLSYVPTFSTECEVEEEMSEMTPEEHKPSLTSIIAESERTGPTWDKINKICDIEGYDFDEENCADIPRADICPSIISEQKTETESTISMPPKKSYVRELMEKQHKEAVQWLEERKKLQEEEEEGPKMQFTKDDAQNLMHIYDTIFKDDLQDALELERKAIIDCYDNMEIKVGSLDTEDDKSSSCAGILNEEKPQPYTLDNEYLAPNHPLMKKFQQMLRDHLLFVKGDIKKEIDELNLIRKKYEQNKFDLAHKLHNLRKESKSQEPIVKAIQDGVETSSVIRTTKEKNIQELAAKHDEKKKAFNKLKADYDRLSYDLENIQRISFSINKWTDEAEGEIKAAKRVICKDTKLQKDMWEEQKKADIIYNYMDLELKKYKKQLAAVREVIQDANTSIPKLQLCKSRATVDIESLQKEYAALSGRWREVITAIAQRDKLFDQLQYDISESKEARRLDVAAIDAIKKKALKAKVLNDRLKEFREHLRFEYDEINRDMLLDMEAMNTLEKRLEELPSLLRQSERDYRRGKKELQRFEANINRLQFKMEKQDLRKYKADQAMLQSAQEQLLTEKASTYRLKLLDEMQVKRRTMELSLANSQVRLSSLTLHMESFKNVLLRLYKEKEAIAGEYDRINGIYEIYIGQQNVLNQQIKVKMNQIEGLSRKYSHLVRISEMGDSPIEIRISIAEKKISQVEDVLKDCQKFWLMLQNYFMNMTGKRNIQVNALNIAERQFSILKQKNMGLDATITEISRQGAELERDVVTTKVRVQYLNSAFHEQRNKHKDDEIECEFDQLEVMENLKNKEMEMLQMEDEVSDLFKDVETYKDLVLDLHREALSWEAKYKIIEDTMAWRKSSHDSQSEITEMKNEIHRMEIRFKQLVRAQQKLIQDLEHCVMHRERIYITSVLTRQAENKWRHCDDHIQLRRKLEENKVKVDIQRRKIRSLKKRDEEACPNVQAISNRISKIIEDMATVRNEMRAIDVEIVEVLNVKYQYLEFTVRSQKHSQRYQKFTKTIKTTATLPRMRSEAKVDQAAPHHVERIRDFLQFSTNMIKRFPEKKIMLCKVMHMSTD
ncbi:coiled-coil domain-containing protein 40 [Teleopsis dalmanni]|uniref:coiled-coil domain-containing protein 40 n=1 Tax=Teleopsis dalmanni TaxID=139649 RepID=UPI0018CE6E76|nr:coiled-coil domain-containing protein 40 [Teleopsis dalmanni]